MRVAWLGSSLDLNIASVRYRLIYPAAMLNKRGLDCHISSSSGELSKSIAQFDALVIVKRLDPGIIQLVSEAYDHGVPVILDFCDDVLDQDYRPRSHEMFRMVFDAISSRVSAIVTTGEHLKTRFKLYGFGGPILIIPDCIETEKVRALGEQFHTSKTQGVSDEVRTVSYLRSAKQFFKRAASAIRHPRRSMLDLKKTIYEVRHGPASVRNLSSDASLSDPDLNRALAVKGKMVIWFGNHGGPHSDFGLLTLLRCANELQDAHADKPFTLVVVSNNREKWKSLIKPIGIPTCYVDWSKEGTVRLLERADTFVMPVGDDSFSLGKSGNRVLLALESRTPVVSEHLDSLDWFESTYDAEQMGKQLVSALRDPQAARIDVIDQRSIAHKIFNLGDIAESWSDVIEHAKPYRKTRGEYGLSVSTSKLLVCINNATDRPIAMAMVDQANRLDIEVGVVVTPEACHRNPRLIEDLISRRISPTFLQRTDIRRTDFRWLRNASALFCPSESSHPAHGLPHWLTKVANSAGVKTFTCQHGHRNICLTDPTDRHHSIASQTIFTWQDPDLLPSWVDEDVRRRCVATGRIYNHTRAENTDEIRE